MEAPKYVVTPTPHIRSSDSIEKTMRYVLLALMPATLAGIFFFGLRALIIIAVSVASAVFFEAVFQKIARRKVTISDGSAVITGLLLALVLPPAVPFWMPVVGSFAAIVLVKQLFGGLGHNFLNPALAGRAVLMAAYAGIMTTGFYDPVENRLSLDALAHPTPLVLLETTGFAPEFADLLRSFWGNIGGSIGETSAIALIVGGLFLLYKKIISWHIPVTFIGTVLVLSAVLHPVELSLYYTLAGGVLLGAFFMATDYPTSPVSKTGKIVFGIGCGVLTVIIRTYGGYPEGVAYSILLMNLCVPIVDRFIRPRVFGTKQRKK